MIVVLGVSGAAYDRVQRRRARRLQAAGGSSGSFAGSTDPSVPASAIGAQVSTNRSAQNTHI
ncbi:hypothetical protein [Nocardioides pacificus]